jgi:uncharacterized protein (TIGR03643 family)
MALGDHVSFDQLRVVHGLVPDEVQAMMNRELTPGSYVAWRKRLQAFSKRLEFFK